MRTCFGSSAVGRLPMIVGIRCCRIGTPCVTLLDSTVSGCQCCLPRPPVVHLCVGVTYEIYNCLGSCRRSSLHASLTSQCVRAVEVVRGLCYCVLYHHGDRAADFTLLERH